MNRSMRASLLPEMLKELSKLRPFRCVTKILIQETNLHLPVGHIVGAVLDHPEDPIDSRWQDMCVYLTNTERISRRYERRSDLECS